MAQYYQVLSQGEKSTVEELRQYYPNILENQTVQYVINSDDQAQQFQGQQILVSSDQLMVIENPSQQVIVDQSAVTYQNPQYVLQESTVDYQDPRQQQVFYMEEVDKDRQVHIEQQPSQPIVLNHQLPQAPIRGQLTPNNTQKTNLSAQVRQQITQLQQQQPRPTGPVQQGQQTHMVQQRTMQQARQTTPVQQAPLPQTHMQSVQHQTPLQQLPMQTENENQVITLAEYKQMLVDNKQRNNSVVASPVPQQRLYAAAVVEQPAKPKSARASGKGKSRRNAGRTNADNCIQYSLPDNTNSTQQPQLQFNPQSQLKMANSTQQKCVPQNQFVQAQQGPQIIQQQQPPPQQQAIRQPTYVQPQFIIQPPSQHQPQTQCPLPPYVASSQIQQIIENTPLSEEYSDSIRMLVLLENGEQRLITFTLPKEMCTIQEILEQVGVPFHPDTKIECTETNHAGINYLVTVGQHHEITNSEEIYETDDPNSGCSTQKTEQIETASVETPAPEPPAEVETPRYVPGLLAVCNHCGYTSENFNRCLRCRYKLPEDVKTRPVSDATGKKDSLKSLSQSQDKKSPITIKLNNANKVVNGPTKKKKPKVVEPEPVVLTLSSDDELDEDDDASKLSDADQLLRRLSSSAITLSAIKKEPSMSDIQQTPDVDFSTAVKGGGKDDSLEGSLDLTTTLQCRTIRIGSYRYIPSENLTIKSSGIILKIPLPKDPSDIKTIIVERKHMVKVLVNFQKALPVIFYYVVPSVGHMIREMLGMVQGSDLYFDPLSNEEAFKRITVLLENVTEDTKTVFKHIYGKPPSMMDELTTKEANDILVKTCPKELSKVIASSGYTEIKQLLIYPPGKGGLPINTEDYLCLAQDQFLNDVIIDFYLKYLWLNLPKEQQEKVHVFSTFFYKRLTTKPLKASRRSHPAELDSSLTPAQKRHARVEKWTKNVNLFEKDFIIIPINENCHWFLAIVCFPGMEGCQTMDGNPVQLEPKRKSKAVAGATIGNVTITTVKKEKEEKAINCDEGEVSDRDEAEGDESELDSEEDQEEPEPSAEPIQNEKKETAKGQPIKQPCILIFDSLAGASRARVVATLRDYLTCEHWVKMNKEKIFNKDVIKGSCPKIPQQTNFTDCGLYLLQYVEQFFKDPIKDYRIPIKQLKSWFEEFIVTKKREDISILIKQLMTQYNRDPSTLPDITFPTLNGKLVIQNPEEDEDEFMDDLEDEEEEIVDECDTSDFYNDTFSSEMMLEEEVPAEPDTSHLCLGNDGCDESEDKPQEEEESKPPEENVSQCDSFVEQPVSNLEMLKPSVSETQKQTSSRETLSYLKSKRISRHKNMDGGEAKKFKSSSD